MSRIQDEFSRFKKIVDFARKIRERHNCVRNKMIRMNIYVDFDDGSLDGWMGEREDECNVRCCSVYNKFGVKQKPNIRLNFPVIGKRIPEMVKEYKKRAEDGDMTLLEDLQCGEYFLQYNFGEWSDGDEELTVQLEGLLEYDPKPKLKKTIQKDTFHELFVAIEGKEAYTSEMLGDYCPQYTESPPQRRMDMFEFRPELFISSCT